jgi:hypothetical protein
MEAQFDSWLTFGVPLDPALVAGGPPAIGARRGNISPKLLPFAQETARDEAGHVRCDKKQRMLARIRERKLAEDIIIRLRGENTR